MFLVSCYPLCHNGWHLTLLDDPQALEIIPKRAVLNLRPLFPGVLPASVAVKNWLYLDFLECNHRIINKR